MHDPDLVITLTVDRADYDVVVDVLWAHHPEAVVESVATDGVTLRAGYADQLEAAGAMRDLERFHPTVAPPDTGDWLDPWRAGARPEIVPPFHVRLPEHAPAADTGLFDVVIEPAHAFGYAHASTRLALALIARTDIVGRRVADVGCGTGILAIAAAAIGAHQVDAVDIDADAVDATRANIIRNGSAAVTAMVGSIEQLSRAPYDLLVANTTAATLTELSPGIRRRTSPTGVMVLSGMLEEKAGPVLATFAPWSVVDDLVEGKWYGAVLRLPGSP